MRFHLSLAFLAALPLAATAQQLPYQNTHLPAEQRAADLVHRMTLAEKVGQMGSAAQAIPCLDVPAYNYWNEALHGVARAGYATMFPQAIGMAATWDAPLLKQVGDAISTEARAKNAEALRHGNHDIYFGLTFWSPNINIFRDPRWGRGQETYGEDPFLTGQLASGFIRGLQGSDPRFFKVIATPKHFAVHSGPEDVRHKFDVSPTPHDLWDTYLPQFRTAIVDAKADSIMCSYNSLYGDPACGSKELLQTILRGDWHFQGFVTSDCGAIDDFYKPNTHRTEPDAEHADRDALLAGTDTNCGTTYNKLGDAVHEGLVQESAIDTSLVRLFTARMKLGLFNPTADVPYAQIPFSAVHSPQNVALARRVADESMVLLKNDGVLPLQARRYKTVAVIGPNAAMLTSLEGNYNGTPHDPRMPVDALASSLHEAKVVYETGSPFIDGFALPVPRTMLHPSANSAAEGLKAEYFAAPSIDGKPLRTTVDAQINFNWDGVNPLPEHPSTGFAVRWSGVLVPPVPGSYEFTLSAGPCGHCAYEQSFRVLVDGKIMTASASVPQDAQKPVTSVNGITGLPDEIHQQYPTHFTLNFSDTKPHTLEIDFVRQHAQHGTGVTFAMKPPVGALLPSALQAARNADLVIAMLGLTPTLEGEEMPINLPGFIGGDRTDIALPAAQKQLLEQLAATGKPLVVVLLNGSALAVNFAQQHANAILEAWYPGEAGGQAIADTLLGVNDPSGRLPVTFYKSIADVPAFEDYSMAHRTYRYSTAAPLYGFGYGLSYTSFRYDHVKLSTHELHAGETLTVEADVTNIGKRRGDAVAELYLMPPAGGNGGLSPHKQLEGFARVALAPGATHHVRFALDPRQLSEVDATGKRAVQPGEYSVFVGGEQPAAEGADAVAFRIHGSVELPR